MQMLHLLHLLFLLCCGGFVSLPMLRAAVAWGICGLQQLVAFISAQALVERCIRHGAQGSHDVHEAHHGCQPPALADELQHMLIDRDLDPEDADSSPEALMQHLLQSRCFESECTWVQALACLVARHAACL